MEPFLWQMVTVDIDGTLTRGHGWRTIAERFGRASEYIDTSRRFHAREIGENEHLLDLLRIPRGYPLSDIEGTLESTLKVDGIAETVRALRDRGAVVALLTHNPPYVCDWYRRRFGFDDFEGTAVQPPGPGEVIPEPGPVAADKRRGLCKLVERHGIPPRRVAHVGDGRADAAIFPLVGGGIALNAAHPDIDRAADLVLKGEDLRVLPPALSRLHPRST